MAQDTSSQAAYWAQSATDVMAGLQTTANGLSATEAQARLERDGPNLLAGRRRTTGLALFVGQFKSPIVVILIVATVVSAATQDWTDAAIILAIVVASAVLGFVQEYRAGNAVAQLRQRIRTRVTVRRDGAMQDVPSTEVVAGDVVMLAAGSLIPADGLVLAANELNVNQAVLTGETFPVGKTPGVVAATAGLADRTNCVYMGTNVTTGTAEILAVRTGRRTAFGGIAERLRIRPPETAFERGVRRFGYLLSEAMLVLVLVIFGVNTYLHKPVLDSLLFSIALAVGLTPQLLPAIINVNLSHGAQAMAKVGVIVQRLASIENLGSMDVLCTDKTGTLTEGTVELAQALDTQGQPSTAVFQQAYLNARLQTGLANPLDTAIIAHGQVDVAGNAKIDEIPYDFIRKRLSVVVRQGDDGYATMITKGALDNVLAVCTQEAAGEQTVPLDARRLAAIHARLEEWGQQGLRVLGVATARVTVKAHYDRDDEQGLVFSGVLLFADPPKAGVAETITDLKSLGVQLKIITGDNRWVAGHTAAAVGIEDAQLLTGADLDALSDDALRHAAERTTLFAEVDPNQKERIILALQHTGHIVGYMGDGINDAPSLHIADVGISVDQAVDVAKEAADFVLLEHDLRVLHQGIIQGRRTLGNTLKYVFMATSANFGNMFSMAAASVLLPFLPMLPKQILLINFLTDLPEMTIAADHVDDYYVARPRRWDIAYIRRFMLIFGPLSSVFDLVTFDILLWAGAGQVQFHSLWFIESVLSGGLAMLVLRTRSPLFRSHPSRAMVAAIALVAVVGSAAALQPLGAGAGIPGAPTGVFVDRGRYRGELSIGHRDRQAPVLSP